MLVPPTMYNSHYMQRTRSLFFFDCASSSPSPLLRSSHLQLPGPMFSCPVGHHLFRKLLRLVMDMPHVLTILRPAGLNSLCIALLACVYFDEKEKIGKGKRMKEIETPGIPLESNLMCPTVAHTHTKFIAPFRRHDFTTIQDNKSTSLHINTIQSWPHLRSNSCTRRAASVTRSYHALPCDTRNPCMLSNLSFAVELFHNLQSKLQPLRSDVRMLVVAAVGHQGC